MINKKKFFNILYPIFFSILIIACSQNLSTVNESKNITTTESENVTNEVVDKHDLIVFAAASMTETLNQIKEMYEATHKNVNVVYNFDSSGTLKTQIEEGAYCDVFISASPKQMNQLDKGSADDIGLQLIDSSTRFDLLENKVALAVPNGNPKNIKSYQDLVDRLKLEDVMLAMGNSDVPVGQYTQKIFDYFNLDEKELSNKGVITYGSNVKEVTTQVKENTVDCGIIYGTDAYSANLQVVDYATKEMCGQVIYPAAAILSSNYINDAKEYLDYLKSNDAKVIFESVGFSPLN